jgi:hypothetical protein
MLLVLNRSDNTLTADSPPSQTNDVKKMVLLQVFQWVSVTTRDIRVISFMIQLFELVEAAIQSQNNWFKT